MGQPTSKAVEEKGLFKQQLSFDPIWVPPCPTKTEEIMLEATRVWCKLDPKANYTKLQRKPDNNPRSTMQSHSGSYIGNSQRDKIVWLNLWEVLENRDKLKSRTDPVLEIPPTSPAPHRFVACKEIKESSKRNECKHGFLGFKQR